MPSAVTVYWRPGCPFCTGLLRSLDRAGVEPRTRNIWEDEDAAAFVRSVADGNETVPTVTVGEHALVNPAGAEVVGLLAEVAPDELPAGHEVPRPGPVTRAVDRLLGGLSPNA
jgi:mycoredoxin